MSGVGRTGGGRESGADRKREGKERVGWVGKEEKECGVSRQREGRESGGC